MWAPSGAPISEHSRTQEWAPTAVSPYFAFNLLGEIGSNRLNPAFSGSIAFVSASAGGNLGFRDTRLLMPAPYSGDHHRAANPSTYRLLRAVFDYFPRRTPKELSPFLGRSLRTQFASRAKI
jgi:hypothetical protein